MTDLVALRDDRPALGSLLVGPIRGFARADVQLLLTSATVLFLELLLIRWIPANVVYVGYFSNFLLMGSFLGIGVGILLGRHRGAVGAPWLGLVLFFVVVVVATSQLNLQLDPGQVIYFGLSESSAAGINVVVLPLVIVLATVVMIVAAMPLGPLLRAMPPLRAYAIDISGSLVGIAAFGLMALVGAQPVVWFTALGLLLLAQALGRGITAWSTVTAVAMVAIVLFAGRQVDEWSPYQRISLTRTPEAIGISANGVPHQGFYLDPDRAPYAFYDQVYRWFPDRHFERVLIVGAGAGNDTAEALRHGAGSVDAVEIDPVIQRIGASLNPARPYSDPRVDRHIDDGRAYLGRTAGRYDLVIYAVTDSLALVSNTANIRLESYLFTQQAFDAVREHLTPTGMFVLYNWYREPWLVERLSSMLERSFGHRPIVRLFPGGSGSGAVLAVGPAIAALDGAAPPGDVVDAIGATAGETPAPATDDWPFIYLREPGVAPFYLLGLGFLLAFAAVLVAVAMRATGTALRQFSPHFFLLGSAFLLLETRSLAIFSLLFGTTWLVNALVFFAILVSVLVAIGVNAVWRPRRTAWLYGLLIGSLVLGFAVPPEALLLDPPWLRYGIASALTFAPVFLANIVFAYSFRDTKVADMAFASNILGAVVGGCLEYLALISGYRSLLIVVMVLYALAYLAATRVKVFADRALEWRSA